VKAAKGLNLGATILAIIGVVLAIIGAYILGVKGAPYRGSGLGLVLLVLGVVVLIFGVTRLRRSPSSQSNRPSAVAPSGKLRIVVRAVIPGIVVGLVLAFLVIPGVLIYAQEGTMYTTVNGWKTAPECGQPGNNWLLQDACAERLFAANLPQEAVYWSTTVDGAGQTLNGQHDYVMQFPAGGLPPNSAFWSLTMYGTNYKFVSNSIDRYDLGSTSGLVPNANGSVDIYIQNAPPAGNGSNWLPAPTGNFLLFLRVYLPGPTILNGSYKVPSVVEAS
jgi:hypothetical protein